MEEPPCIILEEEEVEGDGHTLSPKSDVRLTYSKFHFSTSYHYWVYGLIVEVFLHIMLTCTLSYRRMENYHHPKNFLLLISALKAKVLR